MSEGPAKLVGYTRVSTNQQGDSGLGLAAQRKAVEDYANRNGAPIIAWYTEVESGRRADRPELAKAVAHAKFSGAKLVVAKLDRLSRNVAFLSALMEAKADFVACDNPNANRLTIHILAAMAEYEAGQISARTKAALAAAKARGVKLGSNRPGHWASAKARDARLIGIQRAAQVSAVLRAREARGDYAHVAPIIASHRAKGLSLRQIAAKLNAGRYATREGKAWSAVQVGRVLARAASAGGVA
jgi:DNA invertase Pin-like site-specific DNA recombinase